MPKKPAKSTTAAGVKSAIRVFEVLELFNRIRTPLTVSDISRELEYPLSSSLMLLRCMTDYGYLTMEETGKSYYPTPRLSHLTGWVEYSTAGVDNLSYLMEDLSKLSGETVVLAAEQGLDIVFLRILQSDHPLTLSIKEGSRTVIERSAIGLAALSTKTTEELDTILDRINALPDRKLSATVRQELIAEIKKIRKSGISIGYGRMSHDIGAIAAPLPKGNSKVTYVVSVGGPRERILANQDYIAKSLKSVISNLKKETDIK